MKIINHGSWTRYTPERIPNGFPANIMFCRRDSDGMDWYTYSQDKSVWSMSDSVKMTIMKGIVRAVYRDVSMLFPQNCIVLELIDDVTKDPQEFYGGKCYDAETSNFVDPPPPPPLEPSPMIKELLKRIETLEADRGL